MKKITLSIRYENNFSIVSASDNLSVVEFTTEHANVLLLIFLIRVKLLKERVKTLATNNLLFNLFK